MAVYNEILVGRINRFLQKLTAIKGSPPVPQLASEVMGVIPLFNGSENRYLDSWDKFGAQAAQAAVAAQNSVVNLRNPAGSNVVAVLEKLAVTVGVTAVAMNFNNGITADLGTLATSRRLDARGRPVSGLVMSSANNVATIPANQFGIAQQALGVTYDAILTEDAGIVILPGDGIQVSAGNNAQLSVWALWRERFLEDSERA